MDELLKIENLYVQYNTDASAVHAVNGVSLDIRRGESLGLVGETGAGKSTLAMSVLRILPEKVGEIKSGKITYNNIDITKASEKEMLGLRGKSISMIFQDPMTSLNPVLSVGEQILEVLDLHHKEMSKTEKDKRVDDIFRLVGISPERKVEYPFQFSGGMKQRIVIAMALICEPELLIADEPTTALDVTIQAQILEMMKTLQGKLNTTVLMITHDLGIVAELCDRVSVMYAGEIVETGTVEDVFERKHVHPYTKSLFECIPTFDTTEKRLKPIPGFMPDPSDLPRGCKFCDRCEYAEERCKTENPPVYVQGSHEIKCFRYSEWREKGKEDVK